MSSIAILLPTRNRPELLKRFWKSIVDTADDASSVFMYLYIDDDDTVSVSAAEDLMSESDNVFYFVGPRIVHSDMSNVLFRETQGEDIIFLGGDDLIMKTQGWDTIVKSKFDEVDDKIALVYGKDGGESQHPVEFATHPIIHRKWGEILGYVNPPYFSCDYADTWSNDLADAVGRKYMLPIFHEHMHFTMGKAPFDSTYQESRFRFQQDNVPNLYRTLESKRQEDIQKLKEYIEGYEKK
tara:strand:- start:8457 stop:9173 length:717 start_codon:yes stop_codon:yes gene_type:complete